MFYWGQFLCTRISYFAFCVFVVCYCLVVSTSAIDCLERLGLQNDLLCVEWDVKPYTLIRYLTIITVIITLSTVVFMTSLEHSRTGRFRKNPNCSMYFQFYHLGWESNHEPGGK